MSEAAIAVVEPVDTRPSPSPESTPEPSGDPAADARLPPTPYELIGGEPVVRRLVERF